MAAAASADRARATPRSRPRDECLVEHVARAIGEHGRELTAALSKAVGRCLPVCRRVAERCGDCARHGQGDGERSWPRCAALPRDCAGAGLARTTTGSINGGEAEVGVSFEEGQVDARRLPSQRKPKAPAARPVQGGTRVPRHGRVEGRVHGERAQRGEVVALIQSKLEGSSAPPESAAEQGDAAYHLWIVASDGTQKCLPSDHKCDAADRTVTYHCLTEGQTPFIVTRASTVAAAELRTSLSSTSSAVSGQRLSASDSKAMAATAGSGVPRKSRIGNLFKKKSSTTIIAEAAAAEAAPAEAAPEPTSVDEAAATAPPAAAEPAKEAEQAEVTAPTEAAAAVTSEQETPAAPESEPAADERPKSAHEATEATTTAPADADEAPSAPVEADAVAEAEAEAEAGAEPEAAQPPIAASGEEPEPAAAEIAAEAVAETVAPRPPLQKLRRRAKSLPERAACARRRERRCGSGRCS